MIAKYYNIYKLDWKKVAATFPFRNHVMIKNRFYGYIKKNKLLQKLTLVTKQFEEQGIDFEKLEESDPRFQIDYSTIQVAEEDEEDGDVESYEL